MKDLVVLSDADNLPDPKSLAGCTQAVVPPILPYDESLPLNLVEELNKASHAKLSLSL